MKRKKIILSGIQPSGNLCIANYIGAIRNWVSLQNDYDSIFLIVDLHSLSAKQIPSELRNRCLSFAAQYIACGIDPDKSTIAIQSHISQHAELSWVLNSLTYIGELNRMTQYKDKSKKNKKNINTALFTYPILMAADILLYQANLVPVGQDQKQHLELTRDIAARFNNQYSNTFTIPDPYIPKYGSRIMSLQDPNSKMSKSDKNFNNIISLLDEPSVIKNKIKRAVTDSGSNVIYNEESPGLANLMTIYSIATGDSISKIENVYKGKMYSEFKNDLGEAIVELLSPIQKEYSLLMKDKVHIENILKKGAEKAENKAYKTLDKVYRKIGLVKRGVK
jgi:tryptophanyl-tRNA synthetase